METSTDMLISIIGSQTVEIRLLRTKLLKTEQELEASRMRANALSEQISKDYGEPT
jgi:hypothetical protein